ncbi:hypothetical protein BCR36DRAFT_338379 [Piromyces finnis]|uniref:EB domain-containing protein n=1 Tax=Piromyces finnis TaxID=1754191 RepID=A0A1Y1UVG6_9FUNG|nr:hypothetical protein BCR36DRAFT_338379 [Piromyces finnis]|eukprot:ORX41954.1 hypothetical protein BCR36DRAFT_338379 [Piromyces finnis]
MKLLNFFTLFVTLYVAQCFAQRMDITLEKIKEFKVNTCKSDSDCKKEYETSCYKPNKDKDGYCLSKLFCRSNEKCIYEIYQEKNALLVNYQDVNTGRSYFATDIKPQIILESCNEKEAKNGNCFTRECSKAEECSSGRCENGVCITNDKPLHICTNDSSYFPSVKEGDDFARDKLTCKFVEQEICKKNSACANHSCIKMDGQHICALKQEKESTNLFSKFINFILELIGIVIAGTVIFFIVKHCMRNKSNRRVRKDLKVKYEMEEAFLKDNTKDYVELEDIDEYDYETSDMMKKKLMM